MPNSKPSSPEGAKGVEPVDPDTAAAELLTRRRARADILDYANAIEVPGCPVGDNADDDADADGRFVISDMTRGR